MKGRSTCCVRAWLEGPPSGPSAPHDATAKQLAQTPDPCHSPYVRYIRVTSISVSKYGTGPKWRAIPLPLGSAGRGAVSVPVPYRRRMPHHHHGSAHGMQLCSTAQSALLQQPSPISLLPIFPHQRLNSSPPIILDLVPSPQQSNKQPATLRLHQATPVPQRNKSYS